MTNYHDAEFGPIRLEGSQWMLERRAILGDRPVPLWVEFEAGQEGKLSLLQREAIRQALTLPPDVLRTAAPVVLQNYEVYREAIGDEAMLPLADPVQVWDEVTFSSLFVPPHEAHGLHAPTFVLLAECSWEPEHGLEVPFRHGVALEADQQGSANWGD